MCVYIYIINKAVIYYSNVFINYRFTNVHCTLYTVQCIKLYNAIVTYTYTPIILM